MSKVREVNEEFFLVEYNHALKNIKCLEDIIKRLDKVLFDEEIDSLNRIKQEFISDRDYNKYKLKEYRGF